MIEMSTEYRIHVDGFYRSSSVFDSLKKAQDYLLNNSSIHVDPGAKILKRKVTEWEPLFQVCKYCDEYIEASNSGTWAHVETDKISCETTVAEPK